MRRRTFLSGLSRLTGGLASISVLPLATSAKASAKLEKTPSQAEGPFYPVRFADDSDWNLLRVDSGTGGPLPAGEPLELKGVVQTEKGIPVPDAVVEIWQTDGGGRYAHPRAPGHDAFDPRFQGFGRSITDSEGLYRFLTLVPEAYPGRPPHIHVKIWRENSDVLTTQLYIKDHPLNDRDGRLAAIFFPSQEKLLMAFTPSEVEGQAGQSATYDFVV